jgi:hypothetical protein
MINAATNRSTNTPLNPKSMQAVRDASGSAIERRGNHMQVSSSPAAARTFLRRAWDRMAGLLPHRGSGMEVTPLLSTPNEPSQVAAKLASACYAKMIGELPGMQSRIPQGLKTTYCEKYVNCYTNLREKIPEDRLPQKFAGFFAHQLAVPLIEDQLPDPSAGAINPDGREQWLTWEANGNDAVLGHLGFSGIGDEKLYQERIFGHKLGANALTETDMKVVRGLLDEKHCDSMSVRTMETTRKQRKARFPAGLSVRQKRKLRAKVMEQRRVKTPTISMASNFWLADAVAHACINKRGAPQLPEDYLAWMKSVSRDSTSLLANRLCIASNFRNSVPR